MDATVPGSVTRPLPFHEVSDFKRQQAAEYIVLGSYLALLFTLVGDRAPFTLPYRLNIELTKAQHPAPR